MSTDLADRYGTERRWRRPVLVTAVAVVAAVFLGWLAWAMWFHSTPKAESELTAYRVLDEHRASADVDVHLDAATDPQCRLRAYADDHTVVGEMTFTPREGGNTVDVRTERLATSVELVGCTAEGQSRPQ